MSDWYMLTLIGEDRPGIVAGISEALFQQNMNLGEAEMLRLGGNFSIMMMVSGAASADAIMETVKPIQKAMHLSIHVDPIKGGLHQHVLPNIQVTVFGADRAGIVSGVTRALADIGFNILDLESDVAGGSDDPVYIMHISGVANAAIEEVEAALEEQKANGVNIKVSAIETLVG